ncbi:MAG: hypothetical protein E6556_15765 [Pantoea sp.]|nr:hypothetical protein [Pantoea sp.]
MEIKRLPTGLKIFIFAASLIVFFFCLQWLGPMSYGYSHFWEAAAGLFGDTDLVGIIMMGLGLLNLLLAAIAYRIIVRKIEKRMNRAR